MHLLPLLEKVGCEVSPIPCESSSPFPWDRSSVEHEPLESLVSCQDPKIFTRSYLINTFKAVSG